MRARGSGARSSVKGARLVSPRGEAMAEAGFEPKSHFYRRHGRASWERKSKDRYRKFERKAYMKAHPHLVRFHVLHHDL